MEIIREHGELDFVVMECAAAINDLSIAHEANKEVFTSCKATVKCI